MRKVTLACIIALASLTLFASEVGFVPKDYDFFVFFKGNGLFYPQLLEVPLFSFLLSDNGMGLESVFKSYIENVSYTSGVDSRVFLDALSQDILFAAKGLTFVPDQLFSLDMNYYIELLRNLGLNSLLVLKTDEPEALVHFLAGITNLKLVKNGEIWVLQDTDVAIFAMPYENFLLLSGSKNGINIAISSYENPEERLSSEYPVVANAEANASWISAFFKGDSFGAELNINFNTANIRTRYVEITGTLNGETLQFEIEQVLENSGETEKYVSSVRTMLSKPFIGSFVFSATASGPSDLAQEIASWFRGASEEIKKIYEIVSAILQQSEGRVHLTGDVGAASEIRFAAIFKLKKGADPIALIRKYGARDFGDGEWRMPTNSDQISFFRNGEDFVMTNLSRADYLRLSEKRKLKDDTAYVYISRNAPEHDVMRTYVDLGTVIERMLGIKANSRLLLIQTASDSGFVYYLEVM